MPNEKITVLLGDESFLLEERLNQLIKENSHLTTTNFEDHFDWDALHQSLSTVSLFGDQFLILIKNPWFLVKTASDSDVKALKEIINTINSSDHNVIFYALGKPVDQRRKGFTTLKKAGQVETFTAFKDWETDKLMSWMRARCHQLGKTIDSKALELLAQTCGTDLRMTASELEKISIYVGERDRITLEDVSTVCTGASSSIFRLTDAIKSRHRQSLMESLSLLMDQGEDPIKLMGLVAATLRMYIQLLDLSQQGYSAEQLGKHLGKHPFFLKQLLPDIKRNYTLAKLTELHQALATLDVDIKTGKINSQAGITSFMMTVSD